MAKRHNTVVAQELEAEVVAEVVAEVPAEAVVEEPKNPLAAVIAKVDAMNLGTKSARIRAYTAEGLTRSQIAKILGIRYQHVRNVLITSAKKTTAKVEAPVEASAETLEA